MDPLTVSPPTKDAALNREEEDYFVNSTANEQDKVVRRTKYPQLASCTTVAVLRTDVEGSRAP